MLAFALAALAAPLPLDDSPFSYTYLELGVTRLDVDDLGGGGLNEDVDTYYGRASLGLLGFFFGFVGYETQDADTTDLEADRIDLGVGAHFGLTPRLDLVGSVAWIYNDVSGSLGGVSGSEGGYELELGARWMPIELGVGSGLELNGSGIWVDLDNALSSNTEDVGARLGARVHFLKLASAGVDYTRFKDDDQFRLNLRLSL
jgi:hypothetical protein